METPVLEMYELERGSEGGAIGLFGPRDGNCHFSNFSYRHDDNLVFGPAPTADPPPGVLASWELSGPGVRCADSGYAPESGMLAVPTFDDGRVVLYRTEWAGQAGKASEGGMTDRNARDHS